MHHVESCSGRAFRQPDDATEAEVLGQLVVDLCHVLETDPSLPDQLRVHVHDDVVVLGVDDAEAAMLGEHLEHLPDIAKVEHANVAER